MVKLPTFLLLLLLLLYTSSSELTGPDTPDAHLPGHSSDSRSLPNLPFSSSANRLSDGVSSVSPLTSTGPSFPIYKEGVAEGNVFDPSFRKEHEAGTQQSRIEQGITKPGAGQFEQAQARLQALVAAEMNANPSYNNELPPISIKNATWVGSVPSSLANPTSTFPVKAGARWNPSNFAIQPGESYRVEVLGSETWSDDSGSINVGSLGYDSKWNVRKKCYEAEGQCRSYLRQRLRFPMSNWLHLICTVGSYATLLHETLEDTQRYMPLKESSVIASMFAVDLVYNFTASPADAGEIICFANDAEGLYYDNGGFINVTVTRTSWPPSGDFDENYVEYLYQSLANPSKHDDYVGSTD